jgi:hypothetical protein
MEIMREIGTTAVMVGEAEEAIVATETANATIVRNIGGARTPAKPIAQILPETVVIGGLNAMARAETMAFAETTEARTARNGAGMGVALRVIVGMNGRALGFAICAAKIFRARISWRT